MSAPDHLTSRHVAYLLPRVSLERYRMWRARRRMQRLERLAARQLAGLSPHILSDIGMAAPGRDAGACLRLWTGGAT